MQQAAESMEQQDTENASARLALAVKTNPENIEARTMLADLLWNQGDREEATRQMERVVLHPEVTPELVVKLAWMFFEQKNYALAQKYVSLGLKHNSGMADAWILQGKIYELQNQNEQALTAYHQAAFYAPEDEKIQTMLAKQYLKLGKPQRALEAAQAAKRKSAADAPSEEILLCEGKALSQLQRQPDAVRVLLQARAQNPQSTPILSALAEAQYLNRDFGAAYQTAARGLELSPGNETCSQIVAQVQTASNFRTVPDLAPVTVPVRSQIGQDVQLPANQNTSQPTQLPQPTKSLQSTQSLQPTQPTRSITPVVPFSARPEVLPNGAGAKAF